MRWFLLIAFACAVLVTCGREMTEEEVPLFAAVYGTVRTATGAPVQGAQLKAVAFVEGCSGATVGVGYATSDSLGNYRVRILSLGGAQNPACVGVSAVGAPPGDSTSVNGPTVAFLRGVEVGAEDSVQVDIRLKSTR
jgi:hypothetical protein